LNETFDGLLRRLGHEPRDRGLFKCALTHRSAGRNNNERLEFLGDSILGFVIARELYERFPQADEGQLSRLRSSMVKKETLAEVARELNLGPHLTLGQGELRSGGHTRDSILADAVEAIIAAVYFDTGFEAAEELILRLFGSRLDALTLEAQQKDPKTRLQEYLQARGLALPKYSVIDIQGEPHNQMFTVVCRAPEAGIEAIGRGSSRRKAEQAAASRVLAEIQDD